MEALMATENLSYFYLKIAYKKGNKSQKIGIFYISFHTPRLDFETKFIQQDF